MAFYYEDYEALELGHAWTSRGRTIGESDILTFAGMTGDFHPLHTDAEAARASGYGERIAHGYLTASIAAGLAYRVGLDEETAYALLHIGWTFALPVRIGDTIRVRIILTGRRGSKSHPAHGVVQRRYEVENQRNEGVATGEVVILCKRRAAEGGLG